MGKWRFCEIMIVRRVEFSGMEKQSSTHLVLLHFFGYQ